MVPLPSCPIRPAQPSSRAWFRSRVAKCSAITEFLDSVRSFANLLPVLPIGAWREVFLSTSRDPPIGYLAPLPRAKVPSIISSSLQLRTDQCPWPLGWPSFLSRARFFEIDLTPCLVIRLSSRVQRSRGGGRRREPWIRSWLNGRRDSIASRFG